MQSFFILAETIMILDDTIPKVALKVAYMLPITDTLLMHY